MIIYITEFILIFNAKTVFLVCFSLKMAKFSYVGHNHGGPSCNKNISSSFVHHNKSS